MLKKKDRKIGCLIRSKSFGKDEGGRGERRGLTGGGEGSFWSLEGGWMKGWNVSSTTTSGQGYKKG